MRGKRAKALRRQARTQCDPMVTRTLAVPYKIEPERFVYTAFWPQRSYRRTLKRLKRGGRVTGRMYNAGTKGVHHG